MRLAAAAARLTARLIDERECAARDGARVGHGWRRKRCREHDPEILATTLDPDRPEFRVGDIRAEPRRQQRVQGGGVRRAADADRRTARGGIAFGGNRIRQPHAARQARRHRVEPRVRAQRRDLPRRRSAPSTPRLVDGAGCVGGRGRRCDRCAAGEHQAGACRRGQPEITRRASHAPRHRLHTRGAVRPRPSRRGSRRSGAPTAARRARRAQAACVIALLDDAALVHHDQPVHRRDGRQAVRDRHHGLALHQPVQAFLDRGLDLAVERAGRLVEQQDRRVLQHHARDRDALALAARQLDAALADVRVVAVPAVRIGQALDELVRLGAPRSRHHLRIVGVRAAVEDVVAHRAMQQRGVLRDHADLRAQAVLRDVGDVLPVDQDAAALDVVEAQQQVHDRALAGARAADQADLLAGPDVQREIVDHRLRCRRRRS